MKKKLRIIIAVFIIVIGALLNGSAWGTNIQHPYSTILLVAGLSMIFGGTILLVLSLNKNDKNHNG